MVYVIGFTYATNHFVILIFLAHIYFVKFLLTASCECRRVFYLNSFLLIKYQNNEKEDINLV